MEITRAEIDANILKIEAYTERIKELEEELRHWRDTNGAGPDQARLEECRRAVAEVQKLSAEMSPLVKQVAEYFGAHK